MKKTLLATAIAGSAFAASGAQAATVFDQDGTKLDIYGNIQIAYASVKDAKLNESNGHINTETEDEILDNGTTFGFYGEQVIYNGLVGYGRIEFDLDGNGADEADKGINFGGDEGYVGLKGNFGDARIGSYDILIDDWIEDPISNNEYFDVSDSRQMRTGYGGGNVLSDADNPDDRKLNGSDVGDNEGDQLTYTSPVWGGVQFALSTQYKGDAEGENLTDSGNASFAGGLRYTVGSFSIAGVYDNMAIYDIDSGRIDSVTSDQDLGDQYGITGTYRWNDLQVALKYERFESDLDQSVATGIDSDGNGFDYRDHDYYAISARYAYGAGDVYGAYQYVDAGGNGLSEEIRSDLDDSDEDDLDNRNEVILGATYQVSDAMYTFVEAAWYDKAYNDGDGLAVGVVYNF